MCNIRANFFPCMNSNPHREYDVDESRAYSGPCKIMKIAIGILCLIAASTSALTLLATCNPLSLISTVFFGFSSCWLLSSASGANTGRVHWVFNNHNRRVNVSDHGQVNQSIRYRSGNGNSQEFQNNFSGNDSENRVPVGFNGEERIQIKRN